MALHTSRALNRVVPVEGEEPMDPVDHPTDLNARQTCRGVPRAQPLEEKSLAGIERSGASKIALVQKGRTDGAPAGGDPAGCLGGIPVSAEDVGSEVPEEPALLNGCQQVHVAKAQAQRGPSRRGDQSAQLRVGQRPAGETIGGLNSPLTLHAQVGVKCESGIETLEQVLATRHDLESAHTSEVDSGESGPAQICVDYYLVCQNLVESAGSAPDRVTFGHRHDQSGGECFEQSVVDGNHRGLSSRIDARSGEEDGLLELSCAHDSSHRARPALELNP